MIVFLMATLGGIIYIKSASILDSESESLMVSQLDRVQENIELLVNINKLETRELSRDKRVEAFLQGKLDLKGINRYLVYLMEEKNKNYNYYMDFFILDKGGRIIASCMPTAMNVDLSSRKYFLESVKNNTTVTSDILIGRVNREMIVNTVSPITNYEGEVLGFAGTSIYAEYFSKVVENLELGDRGYYSIIDSDNLVLTHPKKALIGKESSFNVTREMFGGDYSKVIKKRVNVDGEAEFQIFKLMKNKNWILVAALPEKDMYKKSTSLLYSVIFIGLMALIIAMLIGVYVTKRISLPIAAMTEYMNIISRGNTFIGKSISESIDILKRNYNDSIEIRANDEIGRFQKSFNETKRFLLLIFRRFENESRQLMKSSEELAHRIEDITTGTGRFISSLSHDLKNSITVIKGYSKGLRMGVIEDEKTKMEFIDGIYKRTEELEGIIYDVLDSAFEAQGTLRLLRERVDLKEFGEELIDGAREYVEDRGLVFEGVMDIDDAYINIDRMKIKRVWNNLIGNAVKYSSRGSKVSVKIVRELNMAYFEVYDEGIGIKMEEMDKIFDMFYRGSNVEEKGYGLGLYISKSIIEAHGSELKARPGTDKGSVFWFTLDIV